MNKYADLDNHALDLEVKKVETAFLDATDDFNITMLRIALNDMYRERARRMTHELFHSKNSSTLNVRGMNAGQVNAVIDQLRTERNVKAGSANVVDLAAFRNKLASKQTNAK